MTTRARMRLVITVVIVGLLIGSTGGWEPARARADGTWTLTRTERYEMGDLGPLRNTISLGTAPCHFGTVCFGRTVGDTFSVTIEDDSGRTVGGVIHVTTDGGSTVMSLPFCGQSGPLPSVRGRLSVFLDAPGDVRGVHWYGGPGCTEVRPTRGPTAATTRGATKGRVEVVFSGGDGWTRTASDARTEPVRFGTVLNPVNYTGPSHCGAAPDCLVWLRSGCAPRLSGVDPAVSASIVDVRDLAGSRRLIEADGAFGRWMSGTHYEFWSRDCRRVGRVLVEGWTNVTVPRTAAWMTVPGQTGPYQWALW